MVEMVSMSAVAKTYEVTRISEQIYDLLAGRGADVQGAICADLLARWLAGHIVPGDKQATADIREKLLTAHVETVRRLIPINEELILARHG